MSKQTRFTPFFDTLANFRSPPDCVLTYLKECGIQAAPREFELSLNFLQSYIGSPDTFNAYRREVERLFHWCYQIQKTDLASLTRNDLRDFIEFAKSPPSEWISQHTVSRFIENEGQRIPNPKWRPFTARVPKSQLKQTGVAPTRHTTTLNPKSLQALLASLSTFFTFLQQEEYLQTNPVQLLRQKNRIIQREQSRKVTRKLSQVQWQTVITAVAQRADQDPRFERSLFMLSAFYLLGLRISELAETPDRIPLMKDFSPDKEGHWWFTTIGKGNKVRDIAVPDQMLDALKRYRQFLNLTPLPNRTENTPLLHKEKGHGGLGTRHIRTLIQDCFDLAIKELHQRGQADEAYDLGAATVHWLRHTAISHDVTFRPREHVRDDAGHGNATTTDQYIDTDRHARHQSAKDKTLLPFATEESKEVL